MLKDCEWSSGRNYKTGSVNEPIQFYLDGLANSTQFDLLLGYFSSAAINLLSVGFATFISKGGRMRVVINHLLSEADKIAIQNGESSDSDNKIFDLTDAISLRQIFDDYDRHFFECLSYLIAEKRIEFKVIKPKGNGIAHYKSGVFSDGVDKIGYKASCNFTLYGLSENLEELEAFLSWENGRSNKLINNTVSIIDSYFNESDQDVVYLDSNDIELAIRQNFDNKDIGELLVKEEELLNRKMKLTQNLNVKSTIKKLHEEIQLIRKQPKFPYSSGPREYQIEAFNKWVVNGYKGLFAMATGTGKTITSLNCLLNIYFESKSYKAIIIVPTVSLVEQWKKECIKFNFKNIITISSKEKWEDNLSFFNTASKLIDTSYIVIVTYASFVKPKFQSQFELLPKETILIADEVHNMGSPGVQKFLSNIHLERRIGLSATPDRKYDEGGNYAIESFFNDNPPFIVSFSMEKALELGWLCQYLYYPHIVRLTEREQEEYMKISKQLYMYLDPVTKSYQKSPIVDMLLLKRKRILHKAINKKKEFKEIIESEFVNRGNLKYTLIYVPEGVENNYELVDIDSESEEDIVLIDEYTKIVSNTDESLMINKFTANSKNREEILKDFETGKIHVLTSMKCLDEGVDVPRSELAIFCSSTGNPRQFIQRRGRVLRLHHDKLHAVIHDLVVIPDVGQGESTFEMEKNIIKGELARVVDFSRLAINKTHTFEVLKGILDYYNLSLNDL
jgi:superfamily II DNA or RNA helicase